MLLCAGACLHTMAQEGRWDRKLPWTEMFRGVFEQNTKRLLLWWTDCLLLQQPSFFFYRKIDENQRIIFKKNGVLLYLIPENGKKIVTKNPKKL